MTGLRGDAALVGIYEYPTERHHTGPRKLQLEQWADLAALALEDAGLTYADVNGLVCADVREAGGWFVPSTLAEYLGIHINYGERVDLGGATPVGMVWRAAAAIELGLCDVVVCAAPARPIARPPTEGGAPSSSLMTRALGASSNNFGSPQAEFDIPYGNTGQNIPYALIARRYAAEFGYDERALAKIVVEQRTGALQNPNAVFRDKPISIDDVLASEMIADPLHMLEIVMPCHGGAAVVVASADVARRTRHRPVFITGFGERLQHKTPTYAEDLTRTPIKVAADSAFAMAGVRPADVDMVQAYDCYSITVLLTLEDSGFCGKGEGQPFVLDHDLTFLGDFPVNTNGGQLGAGQAGLAGGFTHVVEAVHQLRGDAGGRQVRQHDTAFVTGNGGVMSEQAALVLRGA